MTGYSRSFKWCLDLRTYQAHSRVQWTSFYHKAIPSLCRYIWTISWYFQRAWRSIPNTQTTFCCFAMLTSKLNWRRDNFFQFHCLSGLRHSPWTTGNFTYYWRNLLLRAFHEYHVTTSVSRLTQRLQRLWAWLAAISTPLALKMPRDQPIRFKTSTEDQPLALQTLRKKLIMQAVLSLLQSILIYTLETNAWELQLLVRSIYKANNWTKQATNIFVKITQRNWVCVCLG